MSKKINTLNLEKEIMLKVATGEITMKPKWYFIIGSTLSIVGLAALSVVSIYFVNIISFLLRKHGPMGQWRLETMLNSFPIWVPILAVVGIVFGALLLKKYDFSYKKNFTFIIVGFVISIILSGFLVDSLGLNDVWGRKGNMRRFYQQLENSDNLNSGNRFRQGMGNNN